MPQFSRGSLAELSSCDPKLVHLMNEVIKLFDFKVIQGHRGQEEQHAAFLAGNSQLDWPHGNHNAVPSRAVDIMPWPVDWSDKANNIQRSCFLAGFVLCKAIELGISVRWGGDWNSDHDTRDEKFRDYGHFELV